MEVVKFEEEYSSIEDAFERWKETLPPIASFSDYTISPGHTISTTAGEYYVTSSITPRLIELSVIFDCDKKEISPKTTKKVAPVKRYSRKDFKEKLKELCG